MWPTDFDELMEAAPRKRRRIDKKVGNVSKNRSTSEEPSKIEDLVTHSKKIEEVRRWLEGVGHSTAMLILTGPAGSAKTITLKLVAKQLGFEVQEWINPMDKIEFDWFELDLSDSTAYKEPKQRDKFESFIFRSSRYQTLATCALRRLILIEDFPNYFIRSPPTFHEFLAKYYRIGQCPLVFICTDDDKMNLNYELFPSHVKFNFQINNIKFNPISHTALMKVLKRNSSTLDKENLESIARNSNGDIRAALAHLQFLLTNNKNSKKSTLLCKDVTTDFYQSLGRVLYPKRKDQPSDDGKVFIHDTSTIAEMYDSTFLDMLQENFIRTFGDLSDVVKACEVLSDTDVFCPYNDTLKPYAGFVCVLGLMNSNKHVKKGGFKPMVRSQWADLLKQNRQEHVLTRYPEFPFTRRTLNVDIIPYLKLMPKFTTRLPSKDLDRLMVSNCVKRKSDNFLFKAPLPPPPIKDTILDEELIIEEFDD